MNEDPQSAQADQSILKKRSFFRLRRKSDLVWFWGGLLSIAFSTSVFVYKFRYEEPGVIETVVQKTAVPAPAAPVAVPVSAPAEPTAKPVVKEAAKPSGHEEEESTPAE